MNEVTRILDSLAQGAHAAGQLLPLVYEELRELAAVRMAEEASGNTLNATAPFWSRRAVRDLIHQECRDARVSLRTSNALSSPAKSRSPAAAASGRARSCGG